MEKKKRVYPSGDSWIARVSVEDKEEGDLDGGGWFVNQFFTSVTRNFEEETEAHTWADEKLKNIELLHSRNWKVPVR